MIEFFNNVLTEKELAEYISLCGNNSFDEIPQMHFEINTKNYYYRTAVDADKNIIDKAYKLIKEKNTKLTYKFTAAWINMVYENSNLDDGLHTDASDLTIIIYLNEDYSGGEFEYNINNQLHQIKPKTNSAIMMNNKLPHRVKNVTNGVRYSLVLFFKHIEKLNNSLL